MALPKAILVPGPGGQTTSPSGRANPTPPWGEGRSHQLLLRASWARPCTAPYQWGQNPGPAVHPPPPTSTPPSPVSSQQPAPSPHSSQGAEPPLLPRVQSGPAPRCEQASAVRNFCLVRLCQARR